MNLLNDLESIKRQVEEWRKPRILKMPKFSKQSTYKVQKSNDENPMTEFRNFLLATGGHYGGWAEHDHLLFLKERKKYKGKPKFISAIHCAMPDLSLEDIADHEKWYIQYESLKNSQKEYIQKWKNEKKVQQNHTIETEVVKTESTSNNKTDHQRNIAERIKKWKEQQLAKKKEEEERQKNEKLQLLEEERKKKEIQKMKKCAVNRYKINKLKRIQEEITTQMDSQFPPPKDLKTKNALWRTFRLQDMKFIERKKIIHMQLKQKTNYDIEKLRLGKPFTELKRDPKRIFQPTLIWKQHCQKIDKKDRISNFDLNTIPRLAVPEWRKELKCQ